MSQGLRATYDREYQVICQDLVLMGQEVENAIEQAMTALVESDIPLAKEVISGDEQINQLQYQIEEACLILIATQQPTASDLRSVIASMHIAGELERMGDHAKGIAETVVKMEEEPMLKTLKKIIKMADLSEKMLRDCLQAYIKRDSDWAKQIAAQDSEMDEMYRSVFEKLVEIMAENKKLITRATYLMWCGHNLERIADRVTNIAEQVIFMSTGDMGELNIK
jgi:phosphate transport system protein